MVTLRPALPMTAPRSRRKRQRALKAKRKVSTFPAPKELTDIVDLADWLELKALCAADNNASKADLQSLLNRAGGADPSTDSKRVEGLCLAVFTELESRQEAARDAYPFKISPPLVEAKANAVRGATPYVFCLCLSAWRWMKVSARPEKARRWFEDLSCVAAKTFLAGESLRFASPREPHIKSFTQAVDHLCGLIGEGACFRVGKHAHAKKDDTLDVVAWRHFPDRRPGKLVLFGQCASGGDWLNKRAELNPQAFTNLWFDRPLSVDCMRAFFVPHRVDADDWEETAAKAGIPFDRCRVSYWAHQAASLPGRAELVAWCQSIISMR